MTASYRVNDVASATVSQFALRSSTIMFMGESLTIIAVPDQVKGSEIATLLHRGEKRFNENCKSSSKPWVWSDISTRQNRR